MRHLYLNLLTVLKNLNFESTLEGTITKKIKSNNHLIKVMNTNPNPYQTSLNTSGNLSSNLSFDNLYDDRLIALRKQKGD